MTYEEIAKMVEDMGYLNAYRAFKGEAPEAPFIIFYNPESDDLYADGTNYQRIETLIIELYTVGKDFEAEKAVEDALSAYGLSYSKDEKLAGDNHALGIIYTMGVLINA